MKVAIIADHRHPLKKPYAGGLAMITHKMVQKLAEKGIEVDIYAKSGSQCENLQNLDHHFAEDSPFSCIYSEKYNPTEIKNTIVYSEIFQDLERNEYDIVHNHTLHYLPIILGNKLRTKFITTLHTMAFPEIKFALDYVKKDLNQEFVVVSESLRDQYSKFLNFPKVIRNAIDLNDWEANFEADNQYCMWYGSICKEKAPHLAIEVAIKANKPIILAGRGKNSEYFERFVSPLLKNPLVSYVGEQDKTQINRLLRNAMALLFTSVWEEPSALGISESLASGTPVLSWDKGVASEIITDKVGQILDPLDTTAMAEALKNIERFDREACRKHAEQHCNIDNMIDNYVEFYEALIEENAEVY
ncbi:glycosyltransferase [Zunongwangia sp. HGR-M22]|uniref:glycosyltransferase n=1 Tax=Zunongwangia sp. HGR-M22 TaxID=3015168 RepID=UPI0022DD9AEC|nr:glycosyltransferase [Zunongwangia sp. HGR-M22]WBL27048.1 glycosyltransferase [Zunongwangia sp. HGR-M22]